MVRESARYDPTATLPPHRAFVVHFSTTGRRSRRFTGRVEHLASGTSTTFASLRGLLAFFTGSSMPREHEDVPFRIGMSQ
jgi:hypothetical protein